MGKKKSEKTMDDVKDEILAKQREMRGVPAGARFIPKEGKYETGNEPVAAHEVFGKVLGMIYDKDVRQVGPNVYVIEERPVARLSMTEERDELNKFLKWLETDRGWIRKGIIRDALELTKKIEGEWVYLEMPGVGLPSLWQLNMYIMVEGQKISQRENMFNKKDKVIYWENFFGELNKQRTGGFPKGGIPAEQWLAEQEKRFNCYCDKCGRGSTEKSLGQFCKFPQPDGMKCNGTILKRKI
jgi:hypothetical protein